MVQRCIFTIPPLKDYTIDNYINSQKGLSLKQKELLKIKSEQTGFRQYARKSKEKLEKITKYHRKWIEENYPEDKKPKGAGDRRGKFEPPKKKKSDKSKNPEVKPAKLTDEQKKQQRKEYRKAYNQRPDVKEKNRERKRSRKNAV